MAYLIFALIVLIPCATVLPALLNRRKILVDNPELQNASIARQRLSELEATSADTRLEGEAEVQASLVDDVNSVQAVKYTLLSPAKSLAILIFLPLFALAVYQQIGNPEFLVANVNDPDHATSVGIEDIDKLLLQLEQRIAEQPDNSRGWELAARTYMSLERYQEAENAYSRLNQLVPENPDFLAAWADATIMLDGNSYSPGARTLIQRALKIDPNHQHSLWIAALGASSLGQYDVALSYLETLRIQVVDEPETLEQLDRLINHNRDLSESSQDAVEGSLKKPGKIISVIVNVDSHLVDGLDGSEVVFIIARAKNGPAAPLAVSRHFVNELPVSVDLSSKQAMIAGMNVDNFDEIEIVARISHSGTPKAQPGDYTSKVAAVSGDNQGVIEMTIDSLVE